MPGAAPLAACPLVAKAHEAAMTTAPVRQATVLIAKVRCRARHYVVASLASLHLVDESTSAFVSWRARSVPLG